MLTWKSAWIKDTGGRNTFYASMAKAMASQSAVDNAAKAVQIYGGAGYNTGAPVEKLLRDSFIFKIYEGTSISRTLCRRPVIDLLCCCV